MRRALIYGALAVAVLLSAAAYWSSRREMVVERPSLGGPPPGARPKRQDLVGRPLPAFTAVDQHGRRVTNATLQGRVAVVNVWATWCQPCVAELPRVEREVWQRFRPQVAVIAIARGESAAKIRDFNQRMNLTFSLAEDPRGKITRELGGNDAIPRTYVVDRSGVVVYQAIGYSDSEFSKLVSAVERAVASPGATHANSRGGGDHERSR
ncbi:MAG TPA: TlpA disulfide reductase family protein [Thermoanaerobaculia bacterium]|nr:TlpA disulfide reductase family protein [Thermoanaerobaculia bacterium]